MHRSFPYKSSTKFSKHSPQKQVYQISIITVFKVFQKKTETKNHIIKKQKFIRANNSYFVTENLRKAIMKSSKLRNKIYVKERTKRKVSIIKKNLCVSKNKKDYFGILNNKIATDNRKFRKKSSFLRKGFAQRIHNINRKQ